MRGHYICLLLILSSLAIPLASSAQHAEKLFEKAKSYLPQDIPNAERLAARYRDIGLQTRNDEIRAKTDYLYGLIHYYKSRFYISNKYYSKAVHSAYAREHDDFAEKCWNNMGINYEIQNMFPESLHAYQRSLNIAEKLKDSISIGQSWINVGLLNAKLRKFRSARQTTLKALEYFIQQKDSANIALCYQNLTFISSDEGNNHDALEYAFKGLAISEAICNDFEIAGSYYNIAFNYSVVGKLKESDHYLAKALEVAPRIANREALVSKIYLQKGINEYTKGHFEIAEKDLKHSLELVRASGSLENDYYVYQSLADLYAKSGNFSAYSAIMAEFDKANEQKNVRESAARIDELQALYDFQKNADKIEDQQKSIASQKKQLSILISLVAIILIVLLIITVMHLRMRSYTRSLFESKLEQTKHDSLVSESVSESEPENRQIFALYNRIINLMNDQKLTKDLEISDLGRELGASEEQITEAISLFGKKDYHTFLNTYYIDNICRKMIENGKRLPLKKIIQESPFTSVSAFSRQFREITGLTPEQFMEYSEQKLQSERRLAPKGI